jgi:hypothetical protein
MEKKDINSCMLFKMRDGKQCILMPRLSKNEYKGECFYNIENIKYGYYGGLIDINTYSKELIHPDSESNTYDIVAIKQFESMNQVLYHVLNDIEPEEWDWIRKEKKEIKSVKLPVCIKNKYNK